MPRRVSIADARNHLTRLLRAVERGEAVELTRRGRPIAALVSIAEYRRLREGTPSLLDALAEFRERAGQEGMRLLEGAFDEVRDRETGREAEL